MSGEKFIKHWQVMDNIIEWIFIAIHIQHFTSDSNSKNNQLIGFWKFTKWIRGDLYEWGKVSATMTSDG